MSLHSPVQTKRFMMPVWVFGVISFCRLILAIDATIAMSKMQDGNIYMSTSYFLINWLLVAMLVAETFIYWRIRRKIYKRGWVLAHILLTLIPMVIIPLMYVVLPLLADNFYSGNTLEILKTMTRGSFYVLWACLITGNVFFVATVRKSFHFKPGIPDDTGLIDI
jgi:hypothetical protein